MDNNERVYSIFCNGEIRDFNLKGPVDHNVFAMSGKSSLDSMSMEPVQVNYSFSPQKQREIVDKAFKNYQADPKDRSLITRMMPKLSSEVMEEKVISTTFKLLDRNTSDMHTAVKNKTMEWMYSVEEYANSRQNSDDMITFELEKKQKKLERWVDFLVDCNLISMLGVDSRCFVLESMEKIASILKIREVQREFRRDASLCEFSQKAFQKYFSLFLAQYDYELKQAMRNSEGMEQEIPADFIHENPNKFFFFASKHYKILPKIIKDFLVLKNSMEEVEEQNKLRIISKIIIKILARIQQVRRNYMEKLGLHNLKESWWLHESEILYGENSLVSLFNHFSIRFYHFKHENSPEDLPVLINTLAKYLLIEANYEFRTKKITRGLESGGSFERDFNNFVSTAMSVLLMNKQNEDVLKLAEEISSFEYICQLFIKYGYEVPIKSYIQKWGDEFLNFFVRYSCSYLETLDIEKEANAEIKFFDLEQNRVRLIFKNKIRECSTS